MQTVRRTGILACLLVSGIYAQPVQAQNEKNGFIIEGTIKEMSDPPAYVYLVHSIDDGRSTDSVPVMNGKYVIKSSTEEVQPFRISNIYLNNDGGTDRPHAPGALTPHNMLTVYVNKGDKMNIVSTGTMANAVVTGSEADRDFHKANKLVELFGDTLKKTYEMAKETNNQVLLATIITETNIQKIAKYTEDGFTSFIRTSPASPINTYLLKQLIAHQELAGAGWIELLDELYKKLPAATRASPKGKELGSELAAALKIAPGHKAMDFTQTNTEGQLISLSSYKGKYVLLVFWASWEDKSSELLSGVSKACQTFGSKGLAGLTVSLDADKQSWLQAIKEKQVGNITHLSDLKGKENKVARLYGIKKLPTNLLIDPNGIIIARNLTEFTLNKTLTSIFE